MEYIFSELTLNVARASCTSYFDVLEKDVFDVIKLVNFLLESAEEKGEAAAAAPKERKGTKNELRFFDFV